MSEFVLNPARHGPFPGRLAPETIAAYAAATGDQTAAVLDGRAVPAVFPVILIFTPEEAARADVPEGVWQHVRGGVHGEHDIVVHRPLVPGERLDTSAWLSAVRTTRAGTQIVVQFEQVDADGAVAVEQWWTMVLLGLQGVADLGTMPGGPPVPRRCASPPARVRQSACRQGHRPPVRGGVRRLGGAPLRHRGGARGRFRLRVHPRTVHDGDLHTPTARPAGRRGPGQGPADRRPVRGTDPA